MIIFNVKLWYKDSLMIKIKTKGIYEQIADNAEKRFITSNYEIQNLLLTGKIKILYIDT